MKKLISCFALLVLMGNIRAENEAACEESMVQAEQQETRSQLSEEQEAACQRIMDQLRARYAELNIHADIESALQEVANNNRADFEVAERVFGVQLEDGTWVWPVEARFMVK